MHLILNILHKLLLKNLAESLWQVSSEGKALKLWAWKEMQYYVLKPEKPNPSSQALNDMQNSLKFVVIVSLTLIDLYSKRHLPSPIFQ